MSDKRQETIADIIAEMRIFKCRNLETGELELCNAIANYFADRLEAAHKRERGDCAKLREALKAARVAIEAAKKKMGVDNPIILEIIDAALGAPPRNCDIYSESISASMFDAIYKGPRDGVCVVRTKREKNIHFYYMELCKWLLAPATEGGAK